MKALFDKKIKEKIKETLNLEKEKTLNESYIAQPKTFQINTDLLSDSNLNKEELVYKIKKFIPHFDINFSDFYSDPDKRNYIVSNEKIESTGWFPKFSLDDGIRELIQAYKIIINNDYSRFRNT